MTKPKRHHWWPMAQSRYWMASDGLITVTRADGSTFRTSPLNIGLESELYTRFEEDGTKNTEIEEWFGQAIDSPATAMFKHLLDPSNLRRAPIAIDSESRSAVRQVGFLAPRYLETISTPIEIRQSISDYVAALLVRHPRYLGRLVDLNLVEGLGLSENKNRALDSMLKMFEIYRHKIYQSHLMLVRRVGSSEFLYADGGLVVEEPWREAHGIPFDIHAPLTPDIALQVLPLPLQTAVDSTSATVAKVNNQGVARLNKIILGGANRFVLSRQSIPPAFIVSRFGKPAPKNIGLAMHDGKLEVKFYPHKL